MQINCDVTISMKIQNAVVYCVYTDSVVNGVDAGSSSEIKSETDSNGVMEIKTEADVTGSPHGDTPSTSMYSICAIYYSFFFKNL